MAKFTFKMDDSGLFEEKSFSVESVVEMEDATWSEALNHFLAFLRGCGFVLKTTDFEDTVNEQLDQHNEYEDD